MRYRFNVGCGAAQQGKSARAFQRDQSPQSLAYESHFFMEAGEFLSPRRQIVVQIHSVFDAARAVGKHQRSHQKIMNLMHLPPIQQFTCQKRHLPTWNIHSLLLFE